jgi:hypothetical protein
MERELITAQISPVHHFSFCILRNPGPPSVQMKITCNQIRLAASRKGINMDMHFCSKIYATHLRQSGIEWELVNLLERRLHLGWTFAKHYFTLRLYYALDVVLQQKQSNIQENYPSYTRIIASVYLEVFKLYVHEVSTYSCVPLFKYPILIEK